jgi:hypothetical protein
MYRIGIGTDCRPYVTHAATTGIGCEIQKWNRSGNYTPAGILPKDYAGVLRLGYW